MTQHMVPNIDGAMGQKIKTRNYPRHGTQCVIEYPTNIYPGQSLVLGDIYPCDIYSGQKTKCNICVCASVVQLFA